MRWAGYVACMREMRNAYSILVGKYEGKRSHRRPRCIWENDSIVDFREKEWKGVDWIHLTEDRDQWQAFVNMVMNLWVPSDC